MIGTIMKTFRFIYVTSSFYDESAMIQKAKNIIKSFLHHNKHNHNIKVKMKQTCERCYNIQNKFREYKKRSD